ncbi:PREDICTED: scavenger receptor class F member 2 [Capra hircus]|uniref:scavenger receptor class F member 2 n=1 Tax=Capra hircus TaxID=9925 RepID=UPI00084771D9|nr:PREDICTED: scavenger receptor class F member 2 [Capra hircus]
MPFSTLPNLHQNTVRSCGVLLPTPADPHRSGAVPLSPRLTPHDTMRLTLQTSEVSVKKGQDVRPAPECPGLPQLSPQPGTKAWLREVSGLQGVERGLAPSPRPLVHTQPTQGLKHRAPPSLQALTAPGSEGADRTARRGRASPRGQRPACGLDLRSRGAAGQGAFAPRLAPTRLPPPRGRASSGARTGRFSAAAPAPAPTPRLPRAAWRAQGPGGAGPARRRGAGGPSLLLLLLWPLPGPAAPQELSPRGRNVCRAPGSQELTCCAGWRQQGDECGIAVCEGNSTCSENEVCVRPGECRCRHGYFGANCDTKCPRQFWGPDCKELCVCHPHGQCEDVTGQCTCHARRWGARCEHACQCQHGACHPRSGACRCEPGWWGPQCASACYCSATSRCDPQTGACLCRAGWWGRSCNNQCACSASPCEQQSGRCQCRERTFGARCERYCQCFRGRCHPVDGTCACEPGYRGKYCREPCPAGFYGLGCRRRCGQCKGQQPCTVAEGRCLTCEPGWNGTKCDQPCAAGFYGEGCGRRCPPCRDGHACNHVTGKCARCNAGWIGDRCETKCSNGTYGEDCAFVCADCGSGHCDFQSGRCLCSPGVRGPHCNLTCPPGLHGVDCAQACSCHEDSCDPVTGACRLETNQRKGVMGAGALLALLLGLLLSLLGCCCACRGKDPARGELSLGRKKAPQRLCGRFSRISMKLPRIPLRRQKLPKVVVAHHDLDNTLNCSFLEPPSGLEQPSPSWSSRASFSSFDTTDEGPVYCVPHEEAAAESRDSEAPAAAPVTTPAEEAAPLPASSDSERSASSGDGPGGALYARVARREARPARVRDEARGLSLSPSPERRKPPPPDPATKPKVSWVHGKQGAGATAAAAPAPSPPPAGPEAAPSPSKRKRTPSDTSARPPGLAEEGPALAAPSPPRARARSRGPGLPEPADAGGPPRSAPEAASMLAAELRDKTRSLGRAEGPPGMQGPREKPAPPQKAKRSAPPSSPARASPAPEALGPEKAAAGAPGSDTPRKKTPIQKPPRKKSRELAGEQGRVGAPTL